MVGPADHIESMMPRAENLLVELSSVYIRDLSAQKVSLEALNITHEIIEKCSNALDQGMTAVFESYVKDKLSARPKRGGYFPTAADEGSYRSAMGQWGIVQPELLIPDLDAKLRSLQPFTNAANAIYARIRSLANQKHTKLVPQTRHENKRVNISSTGGGGSVSWGEGVQFGQGVSLMGVPIDPHTQMPVHTRGINATIQTWVSFHLESGDGEARDFCSRAIAATRRAIMALLEFQ